MELIVSNTNYPFDIIRKSYARVFSTMDEHVLISGRGCSSHVTAMYHILKWN